MFISRVRAASFLSFARSHHLVQHNIFSPISAYKKNKTIEGFRSEVWEISVSEAHAILNNIKLASGELFFLLFYERFNASLWLLRLESEKVKILRTHKPSCVRVIVALLLSQ